VDTFADVSARRGLGLRLFADGLVIAWVVLWIVLGLAVDRQVLGLTSVSHSLGVAASTVDQTADALTPMADLPFIGDQVKLAQQRIRVAAARASADAGTSRQSIEQLARLLGWAVAIAPTVPIAVGYATFRVIEWRRRRRARRYALARAIDAGTSSRAPAA